MLKSKWKIAVLVVGAVGLLLVTGVLVAASTKPDSFEVRRSIRIQAPPDEIHPRINDLHAFTEWSPYEKLDPNMTRTFSGPSSGPGATYAWSGDGNIGEGSMEITDSKPSQITIALKFLRPFECHNTVDFLLEPAGDATNVTWRLSGPSPLMSKVMQLFCDMDAMCGPQFEEGLASLKALAEK